MTKAAIEKRQAVANLPFELALKIRELLDSARAEHGKAVGDASDWAELESTVIEILTEDD